MYHIDTEREIYPIFVLLRCSNIYSFNYVVSFDSIYVRCEFFVVLSCFFFVVLSRPVLLVIYCCSSSSLVLFLYFSMDKLLSPVRLIRTRSPVVPIARSQRLAKLNHSESRLRMVRCEQFPLANVEEKDHYEIGRSHSSWKSVLA